MTWLEKIRPILTPSQFERLANILDNAGQVIFGVVVLSPVIAGIDKVSIFVLLSGIMGVGVCWITSVFLAKKEVL